MFVKLLKCDYNAEQCCYWMPMRTAHGGLFSVESQLQWSAKCDLKFCKTMRHSAHTKRTEIIREKTVEPKINSILVANKYPTQ